jgi:hypothetical protein
MIQRQIPVELKHYRLMNRFSIVMLFHIVKPTAGAKTHKGHDTPNDDDEHWSLDFLVEPFSLSAIDLFHGCRRHCVAWQNPRNPHMRIGWLVNEDNLDRALSLRNGSHLPTTQCACMEFGDFAKQRNGGGGREKDLLSVIEITYWEPVIFSYPHNPFH